MTAVDFSTCCNDCLLSMPRSSDPDVLRYKHGKPFYCLHPIGTRKVSRDEKPFSRRPSWCPLNTSDVLVKAAPEGYINPEDRHDLE